MSFEVQKHRFTYVILSKNYCGGDRKLIMPGQVHILRDFAERLSLKFNNEIQL